MCAGVRACLRARACVRACMWQDDEYDLYLYVEANTSGACRAVKGGQWEGAVGGGLQVLFRKISTSLYAGHDLCTRPRANRAIYLTNVLYCARAHNNNKTSPHTHTVCK